MAETYQIDFNNPVHVHFIGIGGISMSGLAEVLLRENFRISGSDMHASELTERLGALGAEISFPQSAGNIKDGIDVVVYTAAIHPDNPEFAAAVSAGIPMLTRAELLGQLMQNYKVSIAVAGTHGKTTTTSMLSHILMEAGTDPTISVGGMLPAIGGNIRVGGGDTFLTEACEYTNSFLSLSPTIGVILNIDADHLDFFKDLNDIRRSFGKFAELLPSGGTLILDAAIPDPEEITSGISCRVVTCSSDGSPADYCAEEIAFDDHGCARFICRFPDGEKRLFHLRVPGMHNVSNAMAAIAAADVTGIDPEAAARGLAAFGGTDRRFQNKGTVKGITIMDDYAHHPTEIQATLDVLKHYPCSRSWTVFQSHTYTRTKALLDEFADALLGADRLILAPIYAAREKDTLGMSSHVIADAVRAKGKDCVSFDTFEEIKQYLKDVCKEGDLILTMGAGDVVNIGDDLLKEL